MPRPKRSTGEPQANAPASKKAKPSATDNPARSKRWARVSASGNSDTADKEMFREKPDFWYAFRTSCPFPGFDSDDEDEEDDEEDSDADDDEEEAEGDGDEDGERQEKQAKEKRAKDKGKQNADGDASDGYASDVSEGGSRRKRTKCYREKCMHDRSPSKYPEHPWVVTRAGVRKFLSAISLCKLRDPDCFGMYTYNDHSAYGALEVLENMMLDFNEAAAEGWKEQWVICECVAHFLGSDTGGLMMMIDDGDRCQEALLLVGRMFLHMLATLDNQDLLSDGTEVQNLGCMMAIFTVLAGKWRRQNAIDEDPKRTGKTFQPGAFEDAIMAYADKRGVTLRGPEDIEEARADANGDLELPKKGAADPWRWKAAFKKYLTTFGPVGGDRLDITTMTPAERKKSSFSGKDPLQKKDLDALKEGLIMDM
ncbi:hypothetical protein GGR56DRAFT_634442, partial [Xylariaceae sp. FL0804]